MPAQSSIQPPSAVLFVDGVRRIDSQIWIEDPAEPVASLALCASYAAGVVCCCDEGAHLLDLAPRRGVFATAAHAVDITTSAGTYAVHLTPGDPAVPPLLTLSAALQRRLGELEVVVAVAARSSVGADDDLLVVDGPLHGRTHLPRALGLIKSHRTTYLPPELNAVVAALGGGERTPVFLMGTSWDRHAWYLRLPCRAGAPWTGVVRVECSADIPAAEAVSLADLSQATLCRFASQEHKDPRAPQNLYPIAGLERQLRRRLGDPTLMYRALRRAAA